MSEETSESGPAGRSYEQAAARLDEIIARLDSGSAELRETLDLCAEAKGLIEYCAGELAAVDEGLKELRLEELAESLTASQDRSGSASPEESPVSGEDDVPF